MENFVLPEGTDTLKDSRELLNNALLTVRSLSSGTKFPTNNLSAGMVCYRTDLKRLYQYKEDGSWTADVAMSISGNANTANSAGTATNAEHANTATNAEHANTATNADHADTASTANKCTGNAATATALQTKRNINGVAFNGTEDITIVNTIEQGGTGATTAKEARENLEVLRRVAALYDNADLNSFTEAGVYLVRKGNATEAQGWTSGVWGTNGFLEVFAGEFGTSANYVKQVYRRCGTSDSNDWQICTRQSSDGGATWGEWRRVDNGGEQRTLANTGYHKTADGLVFAWQMYATNSNKGIQVTINKPIPFTTYYTGAVDRISEEFAGDGYSHKICWLYERSTNTADSYEADSVDVGAFSVFWIGKAV